jgi:hypothetical protein
MNYVVHMFSAPAPKNKTDAGAEREQAHAQCTALGDTPIEILWKISGKHIGEDTN